MGDLHVAAVRVHAGVSEGEAIIDDGLIVQHSSTHDPVSGHEASQMRANVDNIAIVILIRKVEMVTNNRSLRGQ